MNTHISKELAVWLKRHGYKIYSPCKWVVDSKTDEYKMVDDNGPREENTNYVACGFDGADESRTRLERGYGEMFYAYSWFDILVTHAKEFWGEGLLCWYCGKLCPVDFGNEVHGKEYCEDDLLNDDPRNFKPAFQFHAEEVLAHLQKNKIQEAEDYVRKFSLFASPAE